MDYANFFKSATESTPCAYQRALADLMAQSLVESDRMARA